jgi:hypothetical protein
MKTISRDSVTPEPDLPEPRYTDIDEDEPNEHRRPKWMIPDTPLQKKILTAVSRKYYLRDEKGLRHQIILMEKSTGSLRGGLVQAYPTEWIDNCLEWVRTHRANGEWISLKGVVSLLNNADRKANFLARWSMEQKKIREGK